MSASGKLKAMRRRAREDSGLAATDAEGSILRALPQILAVIEAAERQYEAHHPDGGRTLPDDAQEEVRVALAALEHVL